MALAVGSRLGHYDVTALIGEGGMGQVYQATDTKLKRQVALKVWSSRQIVTSTGDEMARLTGTIKRLMSDKGFGFVEAGEGNEFFFHQSACNGVQFDDLREGQAVTFDEGEGPKGPRAENVTLA